MNEILPVSTQKKPNKKTGLIVLLILIIAAIVCFIIQILPTDEISHNSIKTIFTGGYIAALHIDGVIESKNQTYDQEWILKTIQKLTYDTNNKGILLVIDSPGGSVYETDAVYLSLLDYKEKGKPIWAYMCSTAASGGYYLACAADKIYANRNTLTGSIGVISGEIIDASKLIESFGIKVTIITAGENKAMGSLSTPLTTEQETILQNVADECYEQFINIVSESRHLSLSEVTTLADGRIYTAKQALENKLIDQIEVFDTAYNDMKEELFDFKDYQLIHFNPKYKKSFYEFLTTMVSKINESTINSKLEATQLIEKIVPQNMKFPAYYYQQ